jgi:hypothetical protein
MSKLTIQVEKERVDFIFGVSLTEVVLELNQLIKKYGDDATLGAGYDIVDGKDYNYHCVCTEELESDEAHEHRLKYNSSIEFILSKELKRLKEMYSYI